MENVSTACYPRGRLAMDYRAVSAWAAVVAALTAIFAVMRESRRSRFQSGVDILFKLNDMFSTEGMCEYCAGRRPKESGRVETQTLTTCLISLR